MVATPRKPFRRFWSRCVGRLGDPHGFHKRKLQSGLVFLRQKGPHFLYAANFDFFSWSSLFLLLRCCMCSHYLPFSLTRCATDCTPIRSQVFGKCTKLCVAEFSGNSERLLVSTPRYMFSISTILALRKSWLSNSQCSLTELDCL